MNPLVEMLEAAAGPDRRLDALLHCEREGLEFVLLATGSEAYGDICDPSDRGYGGSNKCSPGKLYARYPEAKRGTLGGGIKGNYVQGCTPPVYTSSIDAAKLLLPEGWDWAVGSASDGLGGHAFMRKCGFLGEAPQVRGDAINPALALCAASLRAKYQS